MGREEFPVPLHGLDVAADPATGRDRFLEPGKHLKSRLFPASGLQLHCQFSHRRKERHLPGGARPYLWSKLPEFERFRSAPQRSGEPFELATSFKDHSLGEAFRHDGWRIVSPDAISVDYHAYVDYIQAAKGEFTVAKDQYVRLNTGWFSDRSACYLASGRPVITQETGFSRIYGG